MIHYAQVIKETRQMDISEIPGAGAAGGLGGGVLPFLNAELQSGIDIVLDMLRFRETIQGADLILPVKGNWTNRPVWAKRWAEFCVMRKRRLSR